jgi:hypothetical protein
MIDRFVAAKLWSNSGVSIESLTLADVLNDPEMRTIFEDSFVVVSEHANLAEAKSAMIARPGCSDVFITKTGTKNEPVSGWLTNVDIVRSS